ncbi:hypothetical protein LOC68_15190 [Blastopirellula sp. JC732]|uniref:Carboxypeptidase regulatory-like domain-containing protein n=1 Tax=Blastopirellula sediminis TaxID=2894196 RepID=A0A9X1MP18_9BACT|nr:hypothetical protein [Blastopirellula sediminis]MCC9606970.1 hypothetical protein [Blastopirellula sediminis]MCC9629735.1 hypothetical protein [Blastopirellula sediminis]
MSNWKFAALLAGAALFPGGCSHQEHAYYAKPTTKVLGKVTVDGAAPGSPIVIKCHPADGIDPEHPSVTQALTGPDGAFQLSTYQDGDGVPPGDYSLTFFWGKYNAISAGFVGPDRLKNRYMKPEKSPIKLSIADDQPIDMGTIALTTK